jgi:hypothetical protein
MREPTGDTPHRHPWQRGLSHVCGTGSCLWPDLRRAILRVLERSGPDKPLPAFGEAEPGTFIAERDRRYAAGLAEREAARAARTKATEARALAMSRAIARGELDPRSIKPDPPRWPEPGPVPAEEPADQDSLSWLKWQVSCRPPLDEDEVRRLWRHLENTRIAQSERKVARLITSWQEFRK